MDYCPSIYTLSGYHGVAQGDDGIWNTGSQESVGITGQQDGGYEEAGCGRQPPRHHHAKVRRRRGAVFRVPFEGSSVPTTDDHHQQQQQDDKQDTRRSTPFGSVAAHQTRTHAPGTVVGFRDKLGIRPLGHYEGSGPDASTERAETEAVGHLTRYLGVVGGGRAQRIVPN